MTPAVSRGLEILRRRGLADSLKVGLERYAPGSEWSDQYLWYQLDLRAGGAAQRELGPGLILRKGTSADVELLAQLPRDPEVTRMSQGLLSERLASGAQLWLVVEEDRIAFSCWNFFGRAPLSSMASGEMVLPDDVILLEDSISSPDFRGRGVAPAAWSAIADHHRGGSHRTMVTKVRAENEAVRRALVKAGFAEAARMQRTVRRGRMRVHVDLGDDPRDNWLEQVRR